MCCFFSCKWRDYYSKLLLLGWDLECSCIDLFVERWVLSESQNHRIVGVGRDLCGSSSPTLLLKQGTLLLSLQSREGKESKQSCNPAVSDHHNFKKCSAMSNYGKAHLELTQRWSFSLRSHYHNIFILFQNYLFTLGCNISQNHRMVGVLRDLWRSSSPTPC